MVVRYKNFDLKILSGYENNDKMLSGVIFYWDSSYTHNLASYSSSSLPATKEKLSQSYEEK